MSDEQTQQAAGTPEQAPAAPAEQPAAGSQPVEQPSPKVPEGTPAGTEITSPPSAPAAGEPAKPKAPEAHKQDQKPPSRNSLAYRNYKLREENRELKKKLGEPADEGDDDDGGDPQPDNDNPPRPKTPSVQEEVARQLEPVMTEHRATTDKQEIDNLFSGDNTQHRNAYEDRIRKGWEHPQYEKLAASDLFKILDYDAAVKRAGEEAVERHKQAEKEARESSGSGDNNISNRSGSGSKTASQMTDEELVEHNNRVKAGLPT